MKCSAPWQTHWILTRERSISSGSILADLQPIVDLSKEPLPLKLNLGCGSQPLTGYTNLDLVSQPGVDIAHNLDDTPWPFDDSTADEIRAFDVFEHVDKPLEFVAECWRILAPGGQLYIHTSYWRSQNSYTDPTHKRFCTEMTFDYWIKGTDYFSRYGAAYGGHAHPFSLIDRHLEGSELVFILGKLPVAP
jgi:SAM-dependent methyltransferase